jgi:membrane protein DedA with SNARE-associated domain
MEQHIDFLIGHYGYFGIIIALAGGIVGLPLPDEVLLTYVGYNVLQGRLSYMLSLISAFIGAAGGISLSYLIGYKFGLPLLLRFGPKIHITEDKINRTGQLFEKIGAPLLLVGYFIPGIRHLVAYIAAINSYPIKKFMAYAYTGALIWSFTFITIGHLLGEDWHIVKLFLAKYSVYIVLLGILLMVTLYMIFRKSKRAG